MGVMRALSALVCLALFMPSTALAAKKASSSAKGTTKTCSIKGNIASDKEKIYHLSGCASYNATIVDTSKGERWFCTEKEAKDAGWRKAKNCPR